MSQEIIAAHLIGLVSIASSSLFYTWVWYRPSDWVQLCKGTDPCSRMAIYAHVLKVIQFACMFVLTDKALVYQRLSDPTYMLPGLLLIGFGQHLNFRVYQLLGEAGVYYGFRFGKSIPWVTAWPYNSMRDPQYIGSIATLLGSMVLGAPHTLCVHWLSNYFYLMWLESKVPSDIASLG